MPVLDRWKGPDAIEHYLKFVSLSGRDFGRNRHRSSSIYRVSFANTQMEGRY
ncbi:hypothetical protein L345_01085, partial [Ophiophagus hannah]